MVRKMDMVNTIMILSKPKLIIIPVIGIMTINMEKMGNMSLQSIIIKDNGNMGRYMGKEIFIIKKQALLLEGILKTISSIRGKLYIPIEINIGE